MWRRIPIVPMLFGAFAALAFVSVLAVRDPRLDNWRVFVAAASIGGAYVLLLYAVASFIPLRPRSTRANIGCGCLYALAGYIFLAFVAGVASISTASDFDINTPANAVASLVAFAGVGILAGVMLTRFRRSEAERQKAALEAQAAAFAREQLELARDLQQRLLPPATLTADRYRIIARNIPAAYVAGDFYDFVPLGDRLLLVLADVAGKGVGAGLIMATIKAMIPLLAAGAPDVAPLLGRLNEELTGHLSRREFIALLLAMYRPEQATLTIANAGLPDPLVIGASGDVRPVVAGGPRYPIGIRKNLSYESVTVKLGEGDRVLFFTDGLPEAAVGGEPLGYERLTGEVQRSRGDIESLFASLDKLGAAHDDDWTAVLLDHTSGTTSSAAASRLSRDVI